MTLFMQSIERQKERERDRETEREREREIHTQTKILSLVKYMSIMYAN